MGAENMMGTESKTKRLNDDIPMVRKRKTRRRMPETPRQRSTETTKGNTNKRLNKKVSAKQALEEAESHKNMR
jgi:hypothetical protein